ncbi:MAG TPA: TadE/TadG family type IV pilus assembly protein [Archangium sp.]|uniref:TadE/TadG family type IV pilus assembly protein n=1 Tax=Archangium sp. TaxID=1872627 RepID=UPI002E366853|nr:TadE/TadG family type IV pilus assembly protein [Archangium sp.]HEX5749359.1 TadE/TadG family type IV pilus assembly protein [Archangium sp.]
MKARAAIQRPGGGRESGQAAVESAIVLPMFVFLLLGLLQLSLMHQARLMTKYAAYKAARAGSLHHADVDMMERAALAVLLPLVSRDLGGGEYIKSVTTADDFNAKWKWNSVQVNEMPDADGLPHAAVTICGPVSEDFPGNPAEVDFDDPEWSTGNGGDWKESERTKLRVQVTFNYRMPIPFANQVIHAASRHRDITPVLRLKRRSDRTPVKVDLYNDLASRGLYILPIRATYTMRMQSNLYPQKYPLPGKNECRFMF